MIYSVLYWPVLIAGLNSFLTNRKLDSSALNCNNSYSEKMGAVLLVLFYCSEYKETFRPGFFYEFTVQFRSSRKGHTVSCLRPCVYKETLLVLVGKTSLKAWNEKSPKNPSKAELQQQEISLILWNLLLQTYFQVCHFHYRRLKI